MTSPPVVPLLVCGNFNLMNFINTDTRQIRWSWHSPNCELPWVPLVNVDMSAVTTPATQTVTGATDCAVQPLNLWVIEDLVARMLTRDELEDFAEAKAQKVEDAKTYGRALIHNKILDLCTEMGEGAAVENVLWMTLLDTVFATQLATLKSYCDTVRSAVLSKIQEISACTTWAELDAITIP